MKKVCIALIFISALFAILCELTGADPYREFTFRAYFEYVTENIRPFPAIDFDGDTLSDIWGIVTYIFPLIECVLHNITVILYGFFPIAWTSGGVGTSGGGGIFGDFAGGGAAGGGGGGR